MYEEDRNVPQKKAKNKIAGYANTKKQGKYET